ncbi:flagellar motor switch protein G [endosymbiont of Acanthamoeba sp. UWC8]|uniref:flagellar motor switch protein FliG n=1 Tax=endosymbiont of Acanthamoeba sp. UWC8 TaxID=86106 RepID=UPI0004D11070|nr:flagellar motor switch protein FliG [endosymbiont of Acanthamoeba sp. UWC8]AIF81204.1 flagellar motor switch protein G [endosymbiont of Acanthamoeba sp. UWC8]
MKNKGVEKAAMLIMTLNDDLATKIFSMLEESEIREISLAMSNLGNIPPESIEKLISEFSVEITENLSLVGNIENTERFLRKILGKDKVDSILEDIRGPAGRNIWDKLANVGEELLANYLKKEYPQTAALVLSKLDPVQSSKVLSLFSPEFAFEVIKRMLVMDTVKKEVLERVEKTLKSEFISSLSKTQKRDNNQIIAEVFNNLERNVEEKFMGMLEEYSVEAAEKIRSLMFTFEDLKKIEGNGIQTVLRVIDKSKLALALKGASEVIRDLFIKNMSQRAAKILLEEIEGMGPVKLKDVNEAQTAIINSVKELISKAEIEIATGENGDQMVY